MFLKLNGLVLIEIRGIIDSRSQEEEDIWRQF